MKVRKIATMLLAAASVLLSVGMSHAETKPRWVQKGVKQMNRQSANDAYTFRSFKTASQDRTALHADRFGALVEWVGEQYGVNPGTIGVDSIVGAGDLRRTYRLSLSGEGGDVYAQLVDDWMQLNDEVSGWGFEMHRLYAVSERSAAAPRFDSFSMTRKYPAKAALMSIIPGLGQIYKGQAGKGYAIMGCEVVCIAGIVGGELGRAKYMRLAERNPEVYDSYKSDAVTYRQLRNVSIVAGGALYLYNLIDAAVAKGARRVVVKRRNDSSAELAFAPVFTEYGGAGVGVSLKF